MKNKRKRHLFPGLNQTKAAKKLGVTREHLCLVVNGHRQSRRLLQKISELQGAKS